MVVLVNQRLFILTRMCSAAPAGRRRSERREQKTSVSEEASGTDRHSASTPPPSAAGPPPASAAGPPSPSACTKTQKPSRSKTIRLEDLKTSHRLTPGSSSGPSCCPEPVCGCSAPAPWPTRRAARTL